MADEINFSKSDALIYEKIEKEIGMFPEVYCFTSDGYLCIQKEAAKGYLYPSYKTGDSY